MGRDRAARRAIDQVARDCLAVRLRLLNRVVTGVYDDALRPSGMTAGQLNMLVVIGKRGPVRTSGVSRALRIEASTLSRNLDRLLSRGWLTIAPDADGRAHLYTLSDEGESVVAEALPAWRQAQRQAARLIGDDGVEFLKTIHIGQDAMPVT